ncbi:MAG: cobaltochelatase CobT-related protein [Eubacteriaceae bacterium]
MKAIEFRRKIIKEVKGLDINDVLSSDENKANLVKSCNAIMKRMYLSNSMIYELYNDPALEIVARTTGETIEINIRNIISENDKTNTGKYFIVNGLNFHEIGHCLLSNFDYFKKYEEEMQEGIWWPCPPSLPFDLRKNRNIFLKVAMFINNCLEDGYIEKEMVNLFPGFVKEAIEYTREKAFDISPFYEEIISDNINKCLQLILWEATSGKVKKRCKETNDDCFEWFIRNKALIETGKKCDSLERLKITNELASSLLNVFVPDKELFEIKTKMPSIQPNRSGSSLITKEKIKEIKSEEIKPMRKKVIDKIIEEVAEKRVISRMEKVGISKLEKIKPSNPLDEEIIVKIENPRKRGTYSNNLLSKKGMNLGNKLGKFFKNEALCSKKTGLTTGKRISSKKIYRKDHKIFSNNKGIARKGDCCILVMVDESGSMKEERIKICKDTVVFISALAESLNIPLSVLGHTTASSLSHKKYERLRILNYKTFEENSDNCMKKINSMKSKLNNLDGPAIRFAHEYIKKMSNNLKIIIYLSDGIPYAREYKDESACEDTRKAAIDVSRDGILFVVGAIGNDGSRLRKIYGEKNFIDFRDENTMSLRLGKLTENYLRK